MVPKLPAPVRKAPPVPRVSAETEAVGVPELMLRKAALALALA